MIYKYINTDQPTNQQPDVRVNRTVTLQIKPDLQTTFSKSQSPHSCGMTVPSLITTAVDAFSFKKLIVALLAARLTQYTIFSVRPYISICRPWKGP